MQRFGEWLKEKRKEKGWTLEDVSKRVRTHKGYVSGIENYKVNPPSAKMCRRIAKAFGVDATEVIVRSQTEKMTPEAKTYLMHFFTLGQEFDQACQKANAGTPEVLCALKEQRLILNPNPPAGEPVLDAKATG